MFYPLSCVFVHACLGIDYAMGLLCCLDWTYHKKTADTNYSGPTIWQFE